MNDSKDTPPSSARCEACDAQQKFAGTYASPSEDVMCGFHTSELRKELAEAREGAARYREGSG
jgi:Zn ribbon nucleic-acid-binding protein